MKFLDLSKYTIMLVDDVAFSRQLVFKMLRDMGAREIHHAENGNEALDILDREEDVGFVISDFNMPEFNGLQLLKAIRSGNTAARRDIPFAMLTGFSDRYLVDMALALDVNAFLTKPVSKKALSKRLEKMLERGGDILVKVPAAYEAVTIEEVEEEDVPDPDYLDIGLKNSKETSRVMQNMSSLSGKFEESDLARNITHGVDRLVSDTGSGEASRVVSFLNVLVGNGILELEDVPDVLDTRDVGPDSPNAPVRKKKVAGVWASAGGGDKNFYELPDIPLGAVLAQDILSKDGSLLIKSKIPLTQQVISILAYLKNAGALKLASIDAEAAGAGDIEGNGVLAKFSAGPENDGRTKAFNSEGPPSERFNRAMKGQTGWEKPVPAGDIPYGAHLTRDLYTADGRLYMYAGSELTEKVISILQDLEDLENLKTKIWVAC